MTILQLQGGGAVSLVPATTTTLGGIIVGDGLSIDSNGILKNSMSTSSYTSANGISIANNKISTNIVNGNGTIVITNSDGSIQINSDDTATIEYGKYTEQSVAEVKTYDITYNFFDGFYYNPYYSTVKLYNFSDINLVKNIINGAIKRITIISNGATLPQHTYQQTL